METAILNIKGDKVGTYKLPEHIFGQKANPNFLHEVVTAYLANQRCGNAKTKTRSEISGGGKKPWKQKGMGRARHGSTRSPIWTGGGVVFGPVPRSYRQELPVAKRRKALRQALSAKFADGSLVVIDNISVKEAKTKELASILKNLSAQRKPLIITASRDEKVYLAGRNISGLNNVGPEGLNAYLVLNSGKLLLTKDAADAMAKWGE